MKKLGNATAELLPQNSYVETLTPNSTEWTAFGDGPLQGGLS